KKPGAALQENELLAHFEGRVAKWWTPDAVLFIDSVPIGATGKVLKNQLRDQFGGHYLPAC
ncbi:MAG: long-chain fatty acid--CoA ligase, partial [Acetobacteraceae bacterium]|nr:long-chain fatty acid--CoA ligase [Acetobacteraceae bacterium]